MSLTYLELLDLMPEAYLDITECELYNPGEGVFIVRYDKFFLIVRLYAQYLKVSKFIIYSPSRRVISGSAGVKAVRGFIRKCEVSGKPTEKVRDSGATYKKLLALGKELL